MESEARAMANKVQDPAITDFELGTIVAKLQEIERRMESGERDIRNLTRSNGELTAAIAALTAKIATLPATAMTQHQDTQQLLPLLERIATKLENLPEAPSALGRMSAGITAGAMAGLGAIYAIIEGVRNLRH